MASALIGSLCVFLMPGGGCAARNSLSEPLGGDFIALKDVIAGWLKGVASQLCTLLWLFS